DSAVSVVQADASRASRAMAAAVPLRIVAVMGMNQHLSKTNVKVGYAHERIETRSCARLFDSMRGGEGRNLVSWTAGPIGYVSRSRMTSAVSVFDAGTCATFTRPGLG